MSKPRIFIDGQEGTTGLRIRELLADRGDLDVALIPVEERKDEQLSTAGARFHGVRDETA